MWTLGTYTSSGMRLSRAPGAAILVGPATPGGLEPPDGAARALCPRKPATTNGARALSRFDDLHWPPDSVSMRPVSLALDVKREFPRRFGCRLIEPYGLTEGLCTILAPEDF